MSIKKRKQFIEIIHGNKRENHQIIINKRIFNLNNIERWKLYLKRVLQHINYLLEINEKNIDLFLKDVLKDVNQYSEAFKHKMEYLLGDQRSF